MREETPVSAGDAVVSCRESVVRERQNTHMAKTWPDKATYHTGLRVLRPTARVAYLRATESAKHADKDGVPGR